MQARVVGGKKRGLVCERKRRNFVLIKWQYTVALVIYIVNSKTDRQLKNISELI